MGENAPSQVRLLKKSLISLTKLKQVTYLFEKTKSTENIGKGALDKKNLTIVRLIKSQVYLISNLT
jgi:hypothetical protein